MGKILDIKPEDIQIAEKFRQALRDCRFQDRENCFFRLPIGDFPCLNCPIASFKVDLIEKAPAFLETWKRLLIANTSAGQIRFCAVFHLLFGLGALYSVNRKRAPEITDSLIRGINKKIERDKIGFLNEIVDDLKNLGAEWYEKFWSSHQSLTETFPPDLSETIWLNNILLLKVFLEGMRQDLTDKISDGSLTNGSIEDWKSEREKEEFFDNVLKFLKKEREKKKEDRGKG